MAVLSLPGMSRAANEESSVFWRAKFPSRDLVLFGYVRVRADFFPDIMAEGKRLIDHSEMVLIDMNPSLTLSTTKFKNSDLKPVFPGLAQPNQDELKTILSTSQSGTRSKDFPVSRRACFLLVKDSISSDPTRQSIGLELANYGVSIGRTVKTLASDGEMRSMQKPLTLEIVNSVGPDSITYLLDLRRWLLRPRKSAEIASLGEEITAKGVFTPTDFMDADRLRALFVERIANLPAGPMPSPYCRSDC